MSTIDPAQAELFSGMAAEWWDRKGSSALLHKVNPVRMQFIRREVAAHFGRDTMVPGWLDGMSCLDVGCGGGILTECLARLGGHVTGIDAAEASIDVAIVHGAGQGLDIDYRLAATDVLVNEGASFDIVTCMEVVEHVSDVPMFLASLTALLKPGGLLVFSTPNRTAMSYGVMIVGAEWILRTLPRGTHDWDRFLTPEEMRRALNRAGLELGHVEGIALDPARGFALSDDMRVNYIGAATRRNED
ncbi:bifunctional 2-polyprenyl-6-hydroxyphenol methylase/3-demethylubiquinol 3-O-methyltransferase UbiG [Pacificimonas sp. WHA3]|uniref:Ubiquinone biosynthesis O-methyltransferase n=1 Tax=Pacificimonas pallii TaxID=2827236 RepID=A0ABS6SEH0_9SPHN|nr:bifunctional 2-polyprenyl-6-hydroxyphenol methylase/3-demethylubiquinol 3-O-methyltransferase UbiG [Pacificimonas pallii]MBV7256321.1 bifunctional 2-polyprenyl-6-hydroxyphenol methylase/3-demethylubiquinol 3-O-methyltransferase UbiG [Pacificimonas pallii]